MFLPQNLKHYPQMLGVLLISPRIDEYVVYEDHDKLI